MKRGLALTSQKDYLRSWEGKPLSYDDERLLGGLDWNVAGRFHDALKLGYESKLHKLHLILAFNQNDENRSYGRHLLCFRSATL